MKPWEIIEEQLSMAEVVSKYGYEPNRGMFICCPFHREKTPSMKIYDKSYYCFGCHNSGTAVNFVAKLYNLKPIDACKKISADFGLNIPFDRKLSIFELENIKAEEMARKIKKEQEERLKRQKQGIFEPKEIGPEWEDILYERVTVPAHTDKELKQFVNDMSANGIDVNDINTEVKEKTYLRFKSELIGTPEFDKKLAEYNALVERRTQELNKGEDNYE